MIDKTGSLRAARFSFPVSFVRRWVSAIVLLSALFCAGTLSAQTGQPEPASGFSPQPAAVGADFMAVTANPYATDAAVEILRLGGNALDAAIAAQWVLNLVEPQSSGIGGGGFLLHWDAARKRVSAWDGRETAPRGDGTVGAGDTANSSELPVTGRAVGVPGLVAMIEAAHRRHGKLRWERLFRSAIRLAENGFAVSPRLHQLLRDDPWLRSDAGARALYFDANGEAMPVGATLRNPEFAATLREIAAAGAQALRKGALAERVVGAVARRGGALSLADMGEYRVIQRDPVCGPYRRWRICGMPPPSSGGIGVLQLLGLMERSRLPVGDPAKADAAHLFAEAGRLVYADRARYLADPDFVEVPQRELLTRDYLKWRARLIDPRRSMGTAPAGELSSQRSRADDNALELPATSHLSVVDRDGNAVALTSSIESAFGSRIQVGGFLLNNQLTDFSRVAVRDGVPVANRREAGKRPLSSMAPTLVFDEAGRLHAVLGSPGGSRIINYVARTLSALLDGRLEPAAAVAQAHLGNRNGATEIERGRGMEGLASELEKRGHRVEQVDMTSGLHLIVRGGNRWIGVADPRREGLARGD